MQKIIKRTALLLALALAVVCLGIFASACGDAKEYTITVYYADGTTVVNGDEYKIEVQICDETETYFCYPFNAKVGADGKATFDIATIKENGELSGYTGDKYLLHVRITETKEALELKDGNAYVDSKNASIKVVLKDVVAP